MQARPWLSCLLATVITLVAAEKPNVLFLLSDDHSYPYLSCYGDANVRTPVLDSSPAKGSSSGASSRPPRSACRPVRHT